MIMDTIARSWVTYLCFGFERGLSTSGLGHEEGMFLHHASVQHLNHSCIANGSY